MSIFSSTVCREIAAGCKVIFGPGTRVSSSHVQSMCKFLAIPHIQAHWDPRDVITDTKDPDKDHFSLNLYPYYLSLSTAFRNLIDYWKWTQFTVIYEDNDGKPLGFYGSTGALPDKARVLLGRGIIFF